MQEGRRTAPQQLDLPYPTHPWLQNITRESDSEYKGFIELAIRFVNEVGSFSNAVDYLTQFIRDGPTDEQEQAFKRFKEGEDSSVLLELLVAPSTLPAGRKRPLPTPQKQAKIEEQAQPVRDKRRPRRFA